MQKKGMKKVEKEGIKKRNCKKLPSRKKIRAIGYKIYNIRANIFGNKLGRAITKGMLHIKKMQIPRKIFSLWPSNIQKKKEF